MLFRSGFDLAALPVFPGLTELDLVKFRTRASKTNRQYTEAETHYTPGIDEALLEYAYDAQTSGGLLMSVPAAKADRLVQLLLAKGTTVAVKVGEVLDRGATALVMR